MKNPHSKNPQEKWGKTAVPKKRKIRYTDFIKQGTAKKTAKEAEKQVGGFYMKKKIVNRILCGMLTLGCVLGSQAGVMLASADEATDTLDVFINMSWYPNDSFTGIIPDLIKEETGVDLNVTIATDSNQLGVMIGSGELPDLVFTDTRTGPVCLIPMCAIPTPNWKVTTAHLLQKQEKKQRTSAKVFHQMVITTHY